MKKIFLVFLVLISLASCTQGSSIIRKVSQSASGGYTSSSDMIQKPTEPDWDTVKFAHEDDDRIRVEKVINSHFSLSPDTASETIIIKPRIIESTQKIPPKMFLSVGVSSYVARGFFEIHMRHEIPKNEKVHFGMEYNQALIGARHADIATLTTFSSPFYRDDPRYWEGMNDTKLTDVEYPGSTVLIDNTGNDFPLEFNHILYDQTWTGTHLPKKVVINLSDIRTNWDFSTGSLSLDFGLWPMGAFLEWDPQNNMPSVSQDLTKRRVEWIKTLRFSYRDLAGKKHTIPGDPSFITNESIDFSGPKDILWSCFHSCTAEIRNLNILKNMTSLEIEFAPTDFSLIKTSPMGLLWTDFGAPKTPAERQGIFFIPRMMSDLPKTAPSDTLMIVPIISKPTEDTKFGYFDLELRRTEDGSSIHLSQNMSRFPGKGDMIVNLFHNTDRSYLEKNTFERVQISTVGRANPLGKFQHTPGGVDSTDNYSTFLPREGDWYRLQMRIPEEPFSPKGYNILYPPYMGGGFSMYSRNAIWNLENPPKKVVVDISAIAPYFSGSLTLFIENFSSGSDWNPKAQYTDRGGNIHEIFSSERPSIGSEAEMSKFQEFLENRPKIYFERNTHRGSLSNNITVTASMPILKNIQTLEITYQ